MYYVYTLSHKGKVFYVGKGKGNRMYKHRQIAKKPDSTAYLTNPHLYNTINKYVDINYSKVFESENESEVLEHEKMLINEIGLDNLTNISEGGTGGDVISNHPNKELIKQKMSEAAKKRWEKRKKNGYQVSDETRKKLSEAAKGKTGYWKGKKLSEETKQKMRKPKSKKRGPLSEEHKRAIHVQIK